MKILITGSRDFKNTELLLKTIEKIPKHATIIHGGCKTGADQIAHAVCTQLGYKVIVVPADWDTHGKSAGYIRNNQMITQYKPDIVIAFPQNGSTNRGTMMTVKLAEKNNIPVVIKR